MTFTVQESDSWQPLVLRSNQVELSELPDGDGSANNCRRACRADPTCAIFKYYSKSKTCRKGRKINGEGRNKRRTRSVWAVAKLTNSSPDTTCFQLDMRDQGWLSGTFCPIVRDLAANSYVYQKNAYTPEDVAYLLKFLPEREAKTSCRKGSWIVKQGHPSTDFLDDKTATFQLRGETLACLPPRHLSRFADAKQPRRSTASLRVFFDDSQKASLKVNKQSTSWELTRSPRPCGNPLLPAAAEEAKEEEEAAERSSTASEEERKTNDQSSAVQAFRIHDIDVPSPPGSPAFWLDACECFPVEWGPTPPVSAQQFAKLPNSGENRIPALMGLPQLIARGKLMCMLKHLIVSVATSDMAICSQKCRDDSGCNFFWVGMAAGVGQCRLFSSCGALMTETGTKKHMTNGALYGIARYNTCLISDPGQSYTCMAQTKR